MFRPDVCHSDTVKVGLNFKSNQLYFSQSSEEISLKSQESPHGLNELQHVDTHFLICLVLFKNYQRILILMEAGSNIIPSLG